MSAGTLAVTNNSANVTGTGTTFTTDLRPGDFIGVIIGGTPYTLVALTIDSDTSLTIGTAYTGPTASEVAWYAVPASLQVAITQKVLNDVATMTRGMILDKANWQQFYTGDGDITINLPDASPVTGPSWPAMQKTISDGIKGKAASGSNSDITELKGLTTALSIAQGGTGAKTAADALTTLGALPKAGGTMTGALNFSSTVIARVVAGNLGFSSPASNRIIIPYNGGAFLIQMVSAVATASGGNISFTFPQGFNTISAVLGTSGDANVSSGTVTTLNQSTSGVDFRILEKDGSLRSGASRVNYIAMGVIN